MTLSIRTTDPTIPKQNQGVKQIYGLGSSMVLRVFYYVNFLKFQLLSSMLGILPENMVNTKVVKMVEVINAHITNPICLI
jgi:hypothetical protein